MGSTFIKSTSWMTLGRGSGGTGEHPRPKKLEPNDLMDGKHQAKKASGHFANASVIHFQSPALSRD